MSVKTIFFILLLFFTSVQVLAHSQLDFMPVEEEKHFHISSDMLSWSIVLFSIALAILQFKPKKRTKIVNIIRLILIGLIMASSITLFFVAEEQKLEKPEEFFQANGNVVEMTVKSFNFGYEPNVIEVSAGDTVRLHVENLDFTHTFTVYELGVNEILYPVTNETIEFVAYRRGEFPIFCAIEGHRISGMEGKIIVK